MARTRNKQNHEYAAIATERCLAFTDQTDDQEAQQVD